MKKLIYNKTLFLVLIATGCLSFVYGQKITLISLQESDPIPMARVDVLKDDYIYHYSTDLNGEVQLDEELKNQRLTIDITYTGYRSKSLKNIVIKKDTTIALSPEINEFDEVAVTAQYKSQLVENAVHNIKVIDYHQIEAMAAQSVTEAISKELNIHLSEDNILGTNMQLQGVGGDNIKILVDDVPLTGRQNGNIDLSQIPVDNIERIEVVEGPLSVSYGTDALGGTINIITKKNQKEKFEVNLNNYFESTGKMNNDLTMGWQIKKHQIRLNGGRHFFDGWDPSHSAFYFKQPVADSSRVMQWKPKEQYHAGLNYRYNRKNALFNYSGQFSVEDILNRGEPRAPYFETAFDDYYNTKRINQRFNFQYRFDNDYRLSILAGYSGYLRNKTTKVRDLTEITDVLSSDPESHDTSSYHSFIARGKWVQASDNKKFNYEVGFDLLYELANGRKIDGQKRNVGDYALFVTSEYSPIEELTIRPGLRYSYNTRYKAPLTPSLNIKYGLHETERQKWTLRASYARGFRSPSIKELYYRFVDANHDIVGNQDLKAETSNHYNLSVHQSLRVNEVRFRNKAVFFYNDIHRMITLAQASLTEYSYFNLNRYNSTGAQLESEVNYRELIARIGVGVIGRYNKIESDEEFELDDFLFAPEFKFDIQYHWKKPGLQFGLYYKYSGKLPQVVSNELGEYSLAEIKDYHLADFNISKYVWKNRLKLSVGIKNIFNVTSVEGSEGEAISAHSSGTGMVSIGTGRTYTFGLKFNLISK